MKRILKLLAVVLVSLITLIIGITLFSNNSAFPAYPKQTPNRDTAALQRLATSLQFKTITYDDNINGLVKMAELTRFHSWIKKQYPLCWEYGHASIINKGSLMFEFMGKNQHLKPAVFLAHLDVVPANPKEWRFDPFEGKISKDTVFGRGALDDKVAALGLLEAMEKMLAKNQRSDRTIIFAFGHDEEAGGETGAKQMAALLQKKYKKLALVMDEGMVVTEGIVPGVSKPVAIIGTAEKGYLSIKLKASLSGGHSSMPENENATSVLISALHKIDKHVYDENICTPMKGFLQSIAGEMGFGYKVLFNNLWLTKPLVINALKGNAKTAAGVRTSHVTTLLKSGDKDNVIPTAAEAVINFRILPGQSYQNVLETTEKLVSDKRISISIVGQPNNPSGISSNNSKHFHAIGKAIHESLGDALVTEGLVLAGTDAKHYEYFTENTYRFLPLRLNEQNISSIHGINERISAENYYEMILFYSRLFQNL